MKRRLSWVLRALFGLLLLTTAVGKLLDNRGFAEVIVQYQLGIPEPLLLPLALGFSLVELAVGLALATGYWLRPAALATTALHLGYTLLAGVTSLRGIQLENCGCFGVFLARPLGWSTVVEDVFLTLLALVFYLSASGLERGHGAGSLCVHHASSSRA